MILFYGIPGTAQKCIIDKRPRAIMDINIISIFQCADPPIYRVIALFSACNDMRNFLKVMCQWGHMDNIMDIFDAYDDEVLKSKNILKAELYCVCPPEKAQTDKIKETLKKKYGVSDVLLEVNTDEALMGGYRLEVNGVEYDKSVQGMIKALQNRISGR